MSVLAVLAVATPVPPVLAQLPAPMPERLMIGPEAYLRAPRPFPTTLDATGTPLDAIRARNLAPRLWGMANARPCRGVALADTVGWRSDGGPTLPAGFAPDPSFRSYHGGLRWRRGDVGLAVENGWWGLAYDSAGYLTSCRVRARSGEYLVSEVRTSAGVEFRAIPWDAEWRPSTAVVGHAPTEDALRVVWTAFLAMSPPRCGYMTGEPVHDPRAPAC